MLFCCRSCFCIHCYLAGSQNLNRTLDCTLIGNYQRTFQLYRFRDTFGFRSHSGKISGDLLCRLKAVATIQQLCQRCWTSVGEPMQTCLHRFTQWCTSLMTSMGASTLLESNLFNGKANCKIPKAVTFKRFYRAYGFRVVFQHNARENGRALFPNGNRLCGNRQATEFVTGEVG